MTVPQGGTLPRVGRILTNALLDEVVEAQSKMADGWLRKSGFAQSMLIGFSRLGGAQITIMTDPTVPKPFWRDRNIAVLRGTWQENTPAIKRLFENRNVIAALCSGEAWTLEPANVQEAVDYLEGRGPHTLAEHPNRQEIIFSIALCPLDGYERLITRRIVRSGNTVYSKPRSDTRTNSEKEPLSWVSTWIEECLPARNSM